MVDTVRDIALCIGRTENGLRPHSNEMRLGLPILGTWVQPASNIARQQLFSKWLVTNVQLAGLL